MNLGHIDTHMREQLQTESRPVHFPRIYNDYGDLITRTLGISLGWHQAGEIARRDGYSRLVGDGIDVEMTVGWYEIG